MVKMGKDVLKYVKATADRGVNFGAAHPSRDWE